MTVITKQLLTVALSLILGRIFLQTVIPQISDEDALFVLLNQLLALVMFYFVNKWWQA